MLKPILVGFLSLALASPFLATQAASGVASHNHRAGRIHKQRTVAIHKYKKTSAKVKSKEFKKSATLRGHRVQLASFKAMPSQPTFGDIAGLNHTHDALALASNAALVIDQSSSRVLFEKNASVALPIASITKLMTSLVVMDMHQDMDEILQVTDQDIDREKNSTSRLSVGSELSRADMLHIALMSSENRAASALGRNVPGGLPRFVAAMNAKARELGMVDANFVDSNGLSSKNVASARDLAKLVRAAYQYPLIRQYSTDTGYMVNTGIRSLSYMNSNRLVANPDWSIGLQKTGYISEAGRCLVMQAMIQGREVVMVFLDSKGKYTRLADAGRIRKWLQSTPPILSDNAVLSVKG